MTLIRRGAATVAEWPGEPETATVTVAGVEWTFNGPGSLVTSRIIVGRAQAVDLEYWLLDVIHEDEDSLNICQDAVIDVSTDDGAAFAVLTFDQARELEAALDKWLNEGSSL